MDSAESLPVIGCHVVAVPYPGRGHINPMMNFCKSLAFRADNVFITFVVTEEWLGLIGCEPRPSRITLVSIPNVLPSELDRAADFPGFIEAVMTKMEGPFERLLDRLEPPSPRLIISDTFLIWAVRIGNRRNIPVASFWPMSAAQFTVLRHFHLLERNGHFPVDLSERGNELVDYMPNFSPTPLVEVLGPVGGQYNYVLERFLEAISFLDKAEYLLFASVYELEQAAIDALNSKHSIPVYAIGPATPVFELKNDNLDDKPDYLQWLDVQTKHSVLYVSLGSFLLVSSTQMDEIVAGLLQTGVNFMLVARSEADRLRAACDKKGFVISWCDQLRVLSYESIGGFWSHCGWNSTKEGLISGVPFLTFPIVADQFLNSKLIVEDWKIGLRVKKDVRKENVVRRNEIEKIVRKFMDCEDGETKEMRKRSKELKEKFRQSIGPCGSSECGIKSFITDIFSSSR